MSIVTSNAFCRGNQFNSFLPYWNISLAPVTSLRFSPDYDNQPGQNPALAIYNFDLSTQSTLSPLKLEWSQTQDYLDAWVGWANPVEDCWDWVRLPESNQLPFNATLYAPDGHAMFALALTGHSEWILDYVWFGADKPPFIAGISPISGRTGEEITLNLTYHAEGGTATDWTWLLPESTIPSNPTGPKPTVTLGDPGIHQCVVTASNATGDCSLNFFLTVSEAWTQWEMNGCAGDYDNLDTTSLVLTPGDERPMILFNQHDMISLAEHDGIEWWDYMLAFEEPTDLIITNSSLALDGNNKPVAAYASRTGFVKSIRYDGDTKLIDTIAEATHPTLIERFADPRIAIDALGNLHVSYEKSEWEDDYDADFVKYAAFDGSTWSSPAELTQSGGVMDTGSIAPSVPLALDQNEFPAIAYCNGADNAIRLLNNNGSWYEQDVYGGIRATEISLAFDSAGNPHVAYITDTTPGTIMYCRYTGTAWNISPVPNSTFAAGSISLKLDSLDQPHIAFYGSSDQDLNMACKDPTWSTINIDALGDVGSGCSLAMDSADRAHISYIDLTGGYVKYAVEPAP